MLAAGAGCLTAAAHLDQVQLARCPQLIGTVGMSGNGTERPATAESLRSALRIQSGLALGAAEHRLMTLPGIGTWFISPAIAVDERRSGCLKLDWSEPECADVGEVIVTSDL